jgi:hypothetical protein
MLIDAVDERAVQVEEQGGLGHGWPELGPRS